jgi:hypothetical protein
MAIQIAGTRTVCLNAYIGNATWIGLATGNPGTSTTPANELTGGSPAYARAQTTWTAGAGTSVTINSPAATITYVILATAATVGTSNQADNVSVSSVTLSGQGTLVATPAFAIT